MNKKTSTKDELIENYNFATKYLNNVETIKKLFTENNLNVEIEQGFVVPNIYIKICLLDFPYSKGRTPEQTYDLFFDCIKKLRESIEFICTIKIEI